MRDEQDASLANAVQEIQCRIGRNLLAYQSIEHRLKIVLPYLHPKGSAESLDAWRELRESLKSKTLGPVMKHLSQSVKLSGDPAAITAMEKEFARIVADRNELTHDLLKHPAMSLASKDGGQKMCEHLDRNFEFALSFDAFVVNIGQHFLDAAQESLKDTRGTTH